MSDSINPNEIKSDKIDKSENAIENKIAPMDKFDNDVFEELPNLQSENIIIDKVDILAFIIALAEIIIPVAFGFVAVAAIVIYLMSLIL